MAGINPISEYYLTRAREENVKRLAKYLGIENYATKDKQKLIDDLDHFQYRSSIELKPIVFVKEDNDIQYSFRIKISS